jgi:hypothetical protein
MSSHNAPPSNLPCHTCRPLFITIYKTFHPCKMMSPLTTLDTLSSSTTILLILLLARIVNFQTTREFEHYGKTRGNQNLIWNAYNISKFEIRFLMHPQPSIQESKVNIEGTIYYLFFLRFMIILCNDKPRILQDGCGWCKNCECMHVCKAWAENLVKQIASANNWTWNYYLLRGRSCIHKLVH